ncbi:hypothetical protein [Bythopirellula polymerisocia]|nr:hypothetical protein [Bythopirellula polymerisocia]
MGRYYHAVENEEDWEGTRKLLFQDDWLTKEVDKTASAMRFYRPTTLEQVAVYMGACEAFYEGLCYKALSEKMRNIKLKDEDENTELILTTAEQQLIAWLDMMLAMDYLELANSYEGRPVTNDEGVVELARFYEHCAIASLTVVDEIEVKRVGSRYGLQQDSARAELMYRDVDYAAARLAATEVLPNLHNYFGTGPQYNYARLSATTMLHTWSAMLIAKYYSLGIETDEYYNIIGVRSEKTLTDWLEDSRGQANRAIGSLIDNGIDATTCLQLYSVARTSEGRGEEDRLDALEGYFNVNVTAQVLRRLAGVKGVGN